MSSDVRTRRNLRSRRCTSCSAPPCGYFDDWRRTSVAALAVCRAAGDDVGAAVMLRSVGSALVELDDLDLAVSTLRQAKDLAARVGDRAGVALSGKDLGFAGQLSDAEAELQAAAAGLADAGRPANRAIALSTLGFLRRESGDTAGAVRVQREAAAVARNCADPSAPAPEPQC